ncbi:MAG: serine hydrolase [Flammeovirgaceae bacterium]|nr:serine hydrolase [Flammeovirgaceae bacterium]
MKRFLPLLFSFSFHFLHAQPSFIKDSLESYIQKGMRQWQIPGMAVAIVKDGAVVHLKGYGVKNIIANDPVDENTLFMIGSNTKVFTATALTILEQEKKISLDDKVNKWIPYFKLNDPLASSAVTVRDLLCHRIGFETFQGDFTYWASNLSREDVIKKMALVKAPYGFRTRWGYCNAAFTTAGEIIPAVTGKTWEDYIREKILKPLKMNNTLMLAKELAGVTNAATPYTMVNGKLSKLHVPHIDNLAPAGTISSSAKDMVNWVQTQIDLGKFEGNQVIPQRAITSTREPHSILGLDQRDKQNTHFYLYGLGMDLKDRVGKIVVSHTGGVDGFLSSVMIVSEEKLGIVILTNTDQNNFFQDLTNEIRDAYLNLPYTGFTYRSLQRSKTNQAAEKKVIDSLKSVTAQKNKPFLPLSSYAGNYVSDLYGDVSVKLENNKLLIYFTHHPQLIGELDLLKENTFLCTYSIPTYGIKEIPFHVKDGKVSGFTLRVADFVEFTPYEFVRR